MATQPLDRSLRTLTSLPTAALTPGQRDLCASADSSNGDLRRVLIIASRFPPLASVGAIRIRKFVKYLGEFGWEPVVLTGPIPNVTEATEDARRLLDQEGLSDFPEHIEVHRLHEGVDDWPAALSDRWGGRLAPLTRYVGWSHERWRAGLSWRFERVQQRLSFPDRGVWRTMAAVRLAKMLHRQHRFDAIFSTGMPFSDHLIGMAVQRALKLPWVADFRDPWVEYIHWQQWGGRWGSLATHQAERAVLRKATRVISVNQHMTARFQIRYPNIDKTKFSTVENGFDPSDYGVTSERRRNAKFTMQYAGSLYGARSPENLIKAFERFSARCERARGEAELIFVGRVGPFLERIQNANSKNVRYGGMLGHGATCRAMRQADVNIVLLPKVAGSEKDTTAKVYECLGSGRPILAAVPLNGSAADVLADRPQVFLHDPEDIDGLSNTIERLFVRWIDDELPDLPVGTDLYDRTRRAATEKLADILNQCCPCGIPEAAR